jgi:NitT/TauT family transport system substrate-binding protein
MVEEVSMTDRHEDWTRRTFVGGLTTAGTAGLFGLRPEPAFAEQPPETTRLRVSQSPAICFAPQYLAGEQLFQAEGFTDVSYVKRPKEVSTPFTPEADYADIFSTDVGSLVAAIDRGRPIVVLLGLHGGCYELFVTERVRSLRDLAGKRIAIPGLHTGRHLVLSAILAYIGLDPRRDIDWVTEEAPVAMRLLAEGKVDGFMGFPPEPQELRAKGVGRVLMSMRVDRPWSQHFCCFVAGQRDFVRRHPVATKRALRAILRATSVCALEPDRVALYLVEKGFVMRPDFVRQTLTELPYGRWREYSSEDTMRFYALKLHEVGLVRTSPQMLIEQGTDWRFLNELKKELKG